METLPGPGAGFAVTVAGPALAELHRNVAGCRRCVAAGLLERAAPVLPQPVPSQLVLVGQAPGRVEERSGRPFSGRAGRQLFSWLERAGLGSEEEARRRIYVTSITKCFPGPGPGGSGDRRPSRAEIELCRPYLDRQLSLLRPWLVVAVGQLALDRFLLGRPLGQLVGRLFDSSGAELDHSSLERNAQLPLVLPLPHPSGASRWLNQTENRELLGLALDLLLRLASQSAEEGSTGPWNWV
ncbi:MAG: uracil-DNA glycosylase [Candidatus Dormiibacterota bacterium]